MFLDKFATLFSEPTFMKFLSNVNEEYLEKHNTGQWNAILAGYDSFDVSLPQWYRYVETNGIFKKMAIEYLKTVYINGSWNTLNKELEELRKSDPKKLKDTVKQISVEIAEVKSRICQRDYFAPIQNEVLGLLERVEAHARELTGVKQEKELPINEDNATALRWQGGVSTLCTLFCDLRDLKLKNEKVYLSASNKQIVDFILNSFVDDKGERFEKESVQTYIYKDDKYSRKNRVDISNLENL